MGARKGRAIACPLGRTAKRQRGQPTPQGSSQIIADLNASEARWVEQQSKSLQNPPPRANAPGQNEPMEAPPPDLFEPDRDFEDLANIEQPEVDQNR